MAGLWFEQLEPGLRVEHAITRTVTETDNVLFTTMTMNPQPLHLDAEFAARTEFGRPLVNSLFTLGLVVGLAVPELTLGTTVANLGFSRVDFPAPVFAGDTIRVRARVVEKTPRGRGKRGEVVWYRAIYNQDGKVVHDGEIVTLVECRPLTVPGADGAADEAARAAANGATV